MDTPNIPQRRKRAPPTVAGELNRCQFSCALRVEGWHPVWDGVAFEHSSRPGALVDAVFAEDGKVQRRATLTRLHRQLNVWAQAQ